MHNEVSLCLWHGPAFSPHWSFQLWAHGISALSAIVGTNWRAFHRHTSTLQNEKAGTLLTGDLALKSDTLRKLKQHYAHELPQTGLLQMPHHGSRYNIDFDPQLFGHPRRMGFVSAGLRNSYLHPHLDVIERLNDEYDFEVLWSHERRGVTFQMEFYP